MVVARVESRLVVRRCIDRGDGVRDQILLRTTEVVILIDLEVETSDELDIMLLSEEAAVLGVIASVEVVILPGALADARLPVVTAFARGEARDPLVIVAVDS